MIHKTFSYADLNVTLPEIYEQMGIPLESAECRVQNAESGGQSAESIDPAILFEVQSMLAKIEKFLRPEICFYVGKGELDEANYTLSTNGRVMNIGKIITRQLRGSSLFAFFVCTAGQAYQDFMEEMHATGDMMLEFTANAIGSVLAEKTADLMELELEKLLGSAQFPGNPSSYGHTNRFSPGYCGWHVREQQLLFATFPTEKPCGVTLTDSSLMLPIKSVSGILGIGKDVKKLEYTCGLCDYAKCYKRRKKNPKKHEES